MFQLIKFKNIALSLCVVLGLSAFQVSAQTKNRIDYEISGKVFGSNNTNTRVEFFTRSDDGELSEFWIRIKSVTTPLTQNPVSTTEIHIKSFPVYRYRQITRALRKVGSPWPETTLDKLGFADSIPRLVRFKDQKQVIRDTTHFTTTEARVTPEMLAAEALIKNVKQEALDNPDLHAVY